MEATTDSLERADASGEVARELADLPGPPGLPLIGNVLELRPRRLHRILAGWARRYGPMYRFRIGSESILVLADAALIHQVLRDRPRRYRRWRKMEQLGFEIGADGVFIAEGDEWRKERKLAMYALNSANVHRYIGRLEQVTARLERRWRRAAQTGAPVDVQQDLMRYTVDVTSGLAFGMDMNTLETEGHAIQHHLDKLFPAVARRQTALFPYWHYFKLPADREVDVALAEVKKAIGELIAAARARLAAHPEQRQRPENFLEALIVAQEEDGSFSDEVISGNVMTLLLAGEDTTANTLAFTMQCMIEHPEIQLPMREEADWRAEQGIGPEERLPFIEAVALEAMRCKPVAGHLFFEPNEDTRIDGLRVPKGTPIFVLTGHLGHQERNFEDPGEFRPSRWLDGDGGSKPGHNVKAFLPFGAGPRHCPGRHLAMVQIRMVLAMLCRHFEVRPAPGNPKAEEIYAFTVMPGNLFASLRLRNP